MIVPVRCFTCNKLLAHLWNQYNDIITKEEQKFALIPNPTKKETEHIKLVKGRALDDCGLERFCCRTVFIAHTDIINDVIKYN